MRDLERNRTSLWMVLPIEKVDIIDSDGFFTGEKTTVYSTPTKISISLYPADGKLVEEIFGRDVILDKIGISTSLDLVKEAYFYTTEPTSNFDTTYDYILSNIKPSLNVTNYGFKRRI